MNIEKGRNWGSSSPLPTDGVIVKDNKELWKKWKGAKFRLKFIVKQKLQLRDSNAEEAKRQRRRDEMLGKIADFFKYHPQGTIALIKQIVEQYFAKRSL